MALLAQQEAAGNFHKLLKCSRRAEESKSKRHYQGNHCSNSDHSVAGLVKARDVQKSAGVPRQMPHTVEHMVHEGKRDDEFHCSSQRRRNVQFRQHVQIIRKVVRQKYRGSRESVQKSSVTSAAYSMANTHH